MKRTFEEKIAYNRKNSSKSEFSSGYDLAVILYQSYTKLPKESREKINLLFDDARKNLAISREALKTAENDMAKVNAQHAVDYNNGLLCGLRDAANERKSKNHSLL